MRTEHGRRGAWVVAAALASGCLDRNPHFEEPLLPTTGASMSGTTASDSTTGPAAPPSTAGGDSESEGVETTDTTAALTTSTTGPAVCGDGLVDAGEGCDEGADNADDGACTTSCQPASCGDGLLHAGVEGCDDGNDEPGDGCVACVVPATCKEVRMLDASAASGAYLLDLDGADPQPPIQVFCDMTTDGGGWTVVERSPRLQPIGRPLFVDLQVNPDKPGDPRFRLPRWAIELLLPHSADMRIDCGGEDYLLTGALSIFAGEQGGVACNNIIPILYKEARLKGFMLTNQELCTGVVGQFDGCEGAWHVDESMQSFCGLSPYPWDFMVPVTTNSADAFAVDAAVVDNGQDPPPVHDCHEGAAQRVVMLR